MTNELTCFTAALITDVRDHSYKYFWTVKYDRSKQSSAEAAYHATAINHSCRLVITLDTSANNTFINFTASLMLRTNKLERFSPYAFSY